MINELSPKLPLHLTNVIRAGLLRIHSKKVRGAELNLCLDEAYDVFATALKSENLTEQVLLETIPAWVLRWAVRRQWLTTPWLLLELAAESPPSSLVVFGDCRTGEGAKSEILRHLASRIAHWEAEALEHAANQAARPGQAAAGNLESVAPGSDSAKPTRPKHGPPPDPRSWEVAEAVQTFSPNWKDHLDDICEQLDDLKIPISPKWAEWKPKPNSWARAAEYGPDKVEKVIEQRLKMAETYAPPALPNPRNSRNPR